MNSPGSFERDIEAQIIDLLKPLVPSLTVEPTPDRADDFDVKGARGCILIRWNGHNYDPPAIGSQTRRIEFVLFVGMRSFRATSEVAIGLYEALGIIRDNLTGHKTPIEGREPLKWFPVSESFYGEQKNVWWYTVTFRAIDTYARPKKS